MNWSKKMNKTRLTLALCFGFGMLIDSIAFSGSVGRATFDVEGAKNAPTIDDSSDFYKESGSNGISQANLKKADQIRRKTIRSIDSILKSSNVSGFREFELLLRKGEILIERHDYIRDLEIQSFTKRYDAWEKAGAKGNEPVASYSRSKSEMQKALAEYRKLVRKFRKEKRADKAIYALATTLARIGDDSCVLYFNQLFKDHKKSKLIPDAYLALGEFHFDRNEIKQAVAAYKKVSKYKKSKVYPYAVYKLGWAYYNAQGDTNEAVTKNYKRSVAAFKLVVKLTSKKNKQKFDLRNEALNDLVMVWADAESVDSAWEYFSSLDEKTKFYDFLERLGWIYMEQGKNQQAAKIYTRLLKGASLRKSTPKIYSRLAEIFDKLNKPKKTVASLLLMNKEFVGKTKWIKKYKNDDDTVKNAQDKTNHNLHRYATIYHQRAIKTKDESYKKSAVKLYGAFLASFPKDSDNYELRFYMAELLYDLKRYSQASKNYMMVAEQKPKKGKFLKDAANSGVDSIFTLVKSKKYAKLPKPGEAKSEFKIPTEKMALVNVIDQYMKILPKAKEGDPMRFTAARVYFDHGHYSAAIERFKTITKERPLTVQAKSSVKFVLGYSSKKSEWTDVINDAESFMKNKVLMSQEPVGIYVKKMRRTAMFKSAAKQEKLGNNEKSAEEFMKYAKTFPTDKNSDKAVYNASINYRKAGNISASLSSSKYLISNFKKSPLRANAFASLAETNNAIGEFKTASIYYKRLASDYPSDKRSADALYNAAALNKGLENEVEAVRLFDAYVKSYPNSDIAGDAQLEKAALLEKINKYSESAQAYQFYAKNFMKNSNQVAFASAKSAEITYNHVDRNAGFNALNNVYDLLVQNENQEAYDAREIVAKSYFKINELNFKKFKQLEFREPSKIEKQAAAKQKALQSVAKNYEKIVAVRNAEYAIASLYRLGEMHDNFAETLFKALPPEGSTAAVNKFKSDLEKVAFPLQDQAKDYYMQAYKGTKDLETFSKWSMKIHEKMTSIDSKKHPKIDLKTGSPVYLSHTLKIRKLTSELAH